MIFAVDALYNDATATGQVAGILFEGWTSSISHRELTCQIANVEPYEAGSFFKRELPAISAILDLTFEPIDIIIVDGYVDLEPGHPGIGRRLYDLLGGKVAVVGVAKTPFQGAVGVKEVRRHGTRPLYVSAAGMDLQEAARGVRDMDGSFRIPTLLKRVDGLTRRLL